MGADMSRVYIVSVTGGCCITNTPAGIKNKIFDASDAKQQWQVEARNNGKEVAFKSASDGKYLRAPNGGAGAIIGIGDKQWWTLEPGSAPGSSWIKCNDYPDAYVTNANAQVSDNNTIWCWPKQAVWTHTITWYLRTADGVPVVGPGASTTESNAKVEEATKALQAKESALKEKEEQLAKQEATLVQGQQDSAKKQEDELATKQKELEAKQKDVEAKQKDFEAKQKDVEAKLKEVQSKTEALQQREQKIVSDTENLAAKEHAIAAKGKESSSKEKDSASIVRGNDSGNKQAYEALLKDNEILRKQLATVRSSSFSSAARGGSQGLGPYGRSFVFSSPLATDIPIKQVPIVKLQLATSTSL